jgi:hypothetical protein
MCRFCCEGLNIALRGRRSAAWEAVLDIAECSWAFGWLLLNVCGLDVRSGGAEAEKVGPLPRSRELGTGGYTRALATTYQPLRPPPSITLLRNDILSQSQAIESICPSVTLPWRRLLSSHNIQSCCNFRVFRLECCWGRGNHSGSLTVDKL